ncbi:MAG: hypothetical protein HYY16_08465 [Planctomycetes bacterium]|nr:hypothetical protein [Planctomycetota bacterium]
MNYSVHQLAHLAQHAKQAESLRKDARQDRAADPAALERYRAALAQIVSTLEAGGDPDKDTVNQALKLRRQADRARGPRKDTDLAALTKTVKAILFESQQQVLLDYNPCLIPPKNLKDPVRVGQAHDSAPAINALQRLRSIPARRWETDRDSILEKSLARLEEAHGKFPAGEREAAKETLCDLLERSRALSDIDFELQKEDFAAEFQQFNRKEELKKELEGLVGEDSVVDGKIRSFLLHPRAAALYETRLQQLKNAAAGKPVDLDKISPADHCKNGGCAIKEK